jgi:S-DNA-T family DNA segregation ATPase FtsK/SpoIIIE
MNKTQTKTQESPDKGKFYRSRVYSSGLLYTFSIILTFSFISYLMNWKSDQSQAGTMLDKTIKSSNLFGKVGDWLGNIFIFESIGIASFIIAFFFGFRNAYSEKENFKPWKTIGHSLFFICWLPIFFGAIYKRTGCFKRSLRISDHGFFECDYRFLGLWLVLVASIALYFILEFNLRPSSIKQN